VRSKMKAKVFVDIDQMAIAIAYNKIKRKDKKVFLRDGQDDSGRK